MSYESGKYLNWENSRKPTSKWMTVIYQVLSEKERGQIQTLND